MYYAHKKKSLETKWICALFVWMEKEKKMKMNVKLEMGQRVFFTNAIQIDAIAAPF